MISAAILTPRVDAAIERVLAEQRIVGVTVMIALDGEIAYRRSAGFADREAQRLLRADDIFRLASLTKTLVTAAAMALIERGRLRLEDEAQQYLPDFRPTLANGAAAPITVAQLMTHTAGLSYDFFQPPEGPYARAGVGNGVSDRGISMREQLRRLSSVPLVFPPGRAWGYSVAIDVLGAVIAAAAGVSLPEAVQDLVARPLGLKDTGFKVTDSERLVACYGDARPPKRLSDPDSVLFGPATLHFSPGRIFDVAAFPSGGAGMAGTALEYLTFLEALRTGGGPMLGPDTVRLMMGNRIGALRVNLEPTPAWGFGFGGAVLVDAAHAGVPQSAGTFKWGGVYGNHWYIDPAHKMTVVSLSNTAVEGMAGPYVEELMAAVYGP